MLRKISKPLLKVETISLTNTQFLNFSLTIILIRRIVAETIFMWILQLFPQRQVQLRRHPGTRQYDQRTQVDPLLSLLSPALWLVRILNLPFWPVVGPYLGTHRLLESS